MKKRTISTSYGPLTLTEEEKRLTGLSFTDEGACDETRPLRQREEELAETFAGRRRKFSMPLGFRKTTFQKKVWEKLLKIDDGQTRTYGEIAAAIGDEKAVCPRKSSWEKSNRHFHPQSSSPSQGWGAWGIFWRTLLEKRMIKEATS